MTFIQGNVLGLGMFVAGGAVAGAGLLLLKLPDPVTMTAVGISLIFMDGIVRLRSRHEDHWITSKYLGGYLFFIPAWVLGVIVIVINIVSGLQAS